MVLGVVMWVVEELGGPVVESALGKRVKKLLGGFFEKRRQKKIFEEAIKRTKHQRLEKEKDQLWPEARPILFEEANQKIATKKLGDLIQPYVEEASEVANFAKRIVDECMHQITKELKEKNKELCKLLEITAEELGSRIDGLAQEISGSIEEMLRKREDYSTLFLSQTADWNLLAPKFILHLHDLPYVEKSEFQDALNTVQNRRHLLIRGYIGSGRTKLLSELLRELANTPEFKDEMVHFWRGGPIAQPIDGIWVCDDVDGHQKEFESLLHRMRDQGCKVQILGSVREEEYDPTTFQRLLWPLRDERSHRPDEVEIQPLTKIQARKIAELAAEKVGLRVRGKINISAPPAAIVFAIQGYTSDTGEIPAHQLEEEIAEETRFVKKYIDQLGTDSKIIPLLFAFRLLGWIQGEGVFNRELVKRVYRHLGGDDLAFEFVLSSCSRIVKIRENNIVIQNYILDNFPFRRDDHFDKLIELIPLLGEWAKEVRDTSYLSRLADMLERKECWKDALNAIEKALSLDRQFGDKSKILYDLQILGSLLRSTGQLDRALTILKDALGLSVELGYKFVRGWVLNSIGLVLNDQGRLEEALIHYQKAYQINSEISNEGGIFWNLNNMCNILDDMGRFEEVLAHRQQAYQIAQKLNAPREITVSLINTGICLASLGRLKQALKQSQDAWQMSTDQDYHIGMHASLANQAFILRKQGQLKEALQMHGEASRSVEKIGATYYIAESTWLKGIILKNLGRLDEAMQLYHEANQMAKKHGYVGLQGQVLISMGKIFALQGQGKEAFEKYKDAFEVVQKRGFKVSMVEALINMALLLASSGEPETPIQILDRAFQIATAREDKTSMDAYPVKKKTKEVPQVVPPKGDYRLGLAEIFNAGGYILMRLQRMDAALKALQKAYDLAHAHDYPLIEAFTLTNMGCVFLRSGEQDKAVTKLKAAAQRFEELGVQFEVTTALPGLTKLYPELMEAGSEKEAAEATLDILPLLDPWATAKRARQLLTHIRS